ncbi:MAG: peptidase M1, partial [Bacteroidota bacterium]
HQWWGNQLEAANVVGQKFVLETLAQYSATMVFKKKYPQEKVDQLLQHQYEDYQQGIRQQKKVEPPLIYVEDEKHLYYEKGALSMYALQQYIGEDKVNLALKSFLSDWKTFNNPKGPNRYATSLDLVQYLKDCTPKNLQYLIQELFEKVETIQIDDLIDGATNNIQ